MHLLGADRHHVTRGVTPVRTGRGVVARSFWRYALDHDADVLGEFTATWEAPQSSMIRGFLPDSANPTERNAL
jgi:hypothetical protein